MSMRIISLSANAVRNKYLILECRRKTVLFLSVFFFVLISGTSAREHQPPLAAGQHVQITAHTDFYQYLEITADILQVNDTTVTLLVKRVNNVGRNHALNGTVLELPRSNISEYDVITRGDRVAITLGIAAFLLLPVIPLAFFFLKFKKEERRRRWRQALPVVMAILGGCVGVWIGYTAGAIFGMDKYEVTSLTGTRGIPALIVYAVIGAMIFGVLGYRYGLIKQFRSRRKDEARQGHK
jgi:hypothetical protein